MDRPVATQFETGQHAFSRLMAAGELRTGQDVTNAVIGFAIHAATVAPGDPHLPPRFVRGLNFAAEAAFLRRLADHFNATASEFETLAQAMECT